MKQRLNNSLQWMIFIVLIIYVPYLIGHIIIPFSPKDEMQVIYFWFTGWFMLIGISIILILIVWYFKWLFTGKNLFE